CARYGDNFWSGYYSYYYGLDSW
nr:immunoglobulin heavy chain junction region [Macaca mulatta]MOW98472.1 immunoglobulin heavy chain junction region [Macaca mulatta]MOW98489.1 immunoglobulin heavy chain junction region [Macaca mulatta]MOX00630.1 immunoglobulin heavy chain junction region [Macaca mulatta]MOX01465.1 immunoglobulin heavy chain junction region [Macaca mulatta]